MAEQGGRLARRSSTTVGSTSVGRRRSYDAATRWRYNATTATTSGNWAGKAKSGKGRRAAMMAKQVKDDLMDASGQLKLGRRHRPDYLIFLLAVGLAVFGIVIIYSISSGLYDG